MSLRGRDFRFRTRDDVWLHGLLWEPDEPDPSASPIVLLHGGGANAHWWDHVASALARRGPIYALDFRGHGDSAYPEERRVGAFNTDLEGLVEMLGREDVQLVGHSMGAAVALDHASRFQSTRSLVLLDPARGSAHGSRRRARLALTLRRTYPSFEEARARFRFLPESAHPSEDLRRSIAGHSVREEPDGRFGYKFDPGWFALPSRPPPDPADVRCPTLLVRGSESSLLSPRAALELVDQLAFGRLVEIEEAGHHVLLDRPDRLLEALHAFFDTLPPRSKPPGTAASDEDS
jgi:pimeloyl-ACP methyl ester carboxylesterase